MTTQLQRLEEQGWAAREADPADARAVLISLTPSGREVLAEVRAARAAALAPVLSRMSESEQARIRDTVVTLNELMRAAGQLDVARQR